MLPALPRVKQATRSAHWATSGDVFQSPFFARAPRNVFFLFRVRDGHPFFQIQTSPSDSSVEYRSS